MTKIKREDIHIISKHSNWSEEGINVTFKKEIYSNKASWLKFINLLFISLGIGFTTAGIIFFFAYNWSDLHKFIKIGLIEALIIITTLIIVFTKVSINIKNIILTGTSILVGVLFAVFGQIYQTGANAYDFFLGWTMAITIWVVISNFAPLWLLFITLVNTTILLYIEQVAHDWSSAFVFLLLFVINTLFLVLALLCNKKINEVTTPIWFTNLIALVALTYSTIGICIGIFNEKDVYFIPLLLITLVVSIIGFKHSIKVKNTFYLSIISFSIIIIFSTLFIKLSHDANMFFFISLFVIVSVTLLIKILIDLQKKWKN